MTKTPRISISIAIDATALVESLVCFDFMMLNASRPAGAV
jgi:hypothetical protein